MQVASRFIAVVAALGLVGAYASQSTSTAQTAAPLQRTKAWKALGRVGACAETTITKIADASDNRLSPIPFKSDETLDKDGEPMMDQGSYVQYPNGAGVECRRGPFQAGRPRAALHGLEAEEVSTGR